MKQFLTNFVTSVAGIVQSLLGAFFVPGQPSPVAPQKRRRSFTAEVHRADDLLVLQLDFYNLRIDSGAGAKQLVADGPGDSFLVAHFPPQHVAEPAFLETDSSNPLQLPPVAARMAGESRLVFHLSPALLPLDFTLEAVLQALSRAAPLVGDRIGQPPATPPVGGLAAFGGSGSQISAIEAPWRLTLSPHPDGRWAHSPAPVRNGARTELWHTRLGVKPASGPAVDEASTAHRTARAVFSPDYVPGTPSAPDTDLSPFRTSLKRYHRHNLVRLTADRTLPGNLPVAVERLMLSSLGSWLEVHGAWNPSLTGIGIVDWRHLATLGRDQFVRVVEAGFLFPLGNRAVLIEITERKLEEVDPQIASSKGPVAYLRQRLFVVVREPVKTFAHRALPFRTVTFKTLITPNLIAPTDEFGALVGSDGASAFWPRYEVAGVKQDVLFQIEGVDWDGRTASFAAPQIFVPVSVDSAADIIQKLVAAYNGQAGVFAPEPDEGARRSRPLGGQKVAFAPALKAGDTTLETETVILAALDASGSPHFLPALRGARVGIPAVRQVAGESAVSLIRFDTGYLGAKPTEFGNAGEVFARIDAPAGIKFPIEKTGGLVAPDFTPKGLSRSFGPIGDVDAFAQGSFNPAAIFADVEILGGVQLGRIFKSIPFSWPSQAGETVPGLTSVATPGGIQTRYAWTISGDQLQAQPIDKPLFEPLPGAKFTLDSVIDAPVGKPASFQVDGRLEKFQIVLPPGDGALIAAQFDHISFGAGTGKKVDVSVGFDEIVFKGPLSFVDDIRKYIPLGGFVDPPYLDVDASGVSAGFTLGIPTIGVGIFVLQDLSLTAGFHLPFVGGAAALRFAFCERDHPFLLTVSALGGGGFFGLDLTTKEVVNVEASLEFGAAVAINLGVAAGKASITGGVYFQKTGADLQLTAFFRAAGSLSVLGLVTVSVELYVGLTFQSKEPNGGTLAGTASVAVKIKIAFFSKSISVSIHRELAGSDPTFVQLIGPGDWAQYCGAFAIEAP